MKQFRSTASVIIAAAYYLAACSPVETDVVVLEDAVKVHQSTYKDKYEHLASDIHKSRYEDLLVVRDHFSDDELGPNALKEEYESIDVSRSTFNRALLQVFLFLSRVR